MLPEPSGEIALVDDEKNIRETVGFALRRAGYRVTTYADGLEAWRAFEARLPDLAILDILMPRMDGLELCRRLRARSEVLPILFLTSRDEEFDRVLGLELGADDYLCKPFSMRELLARVKVLLRRLALSRGEESDSKEEVLEVGPLVMDLLRYFVRWKGENVPLTVTEFLILRALWRAAPATSRAAPSCWRRATHTTRTWRSAPWTAISSACGASSSRSIPTSPRSRRCTASATGFAAAQKPKGRRPYAPSLTHPAAGQILRTAARFMGKADGSAHRVSPVV
jgi:two-component system response regulator ChvI